MPPCTELLFFALLITAFPVKAQFEFNDQEILYDFLVDALPICEISCIAVLRPADQNPQQKSVIDGLTYRLAKEYPGYDNRKPTVTSYTSDLYKTSYMDPSKRQRDSCVSWVTIVMVNNSTNHQLADFSDSYFFDQPIWILFVNRSEVATLVKTIKIRLSTKLFVVQDQGNGLLNSSLIDRFGVKTSYVLWTKKDGLTNRLVDYPPMKGLELRVGIMEFLPYVQPHTNESGHITAVTGFYGDLWKDLQEALQFHSVFVEPEEPIFGSYNENGNWTGLYRLIARKQADVILNELTITQEHSQIVDFLHPIERSQYKVFYKIDAEFFDWLKMFRPLDINVWLAVVIWIIVGGTAAYLVITMEKNFQNPRRHLSLISCVYFVLRTMCNQGSEQVPKLWALRIFFLTAYLTAAVILPSYSASLISVLTVKTPVEPFKELKDILATDYKLIVESNSTDNDFFEKTKDPVHRKIYEKSMMKEENTLLYEEAMERACGNSRILFFSTLNEVAAVNMYENISCVLLPLKSDISPAYKTIAIVKHSHYLPILKRQLFRMIQFGLVNRYKRLYLQDSYEEPIQHDASIGLLDVGAVFIYFGILIALSVGILFLEILSWKNYLRTRSDRKLARKPKQIIFYGVQPLNSNFWIQEDYYSRKPSKYPQQN